ncbi:MAG TPA: alanine racemase [Smithella sp.]|nr:alanine racemase [Smithella sp.]MDM7988453.1 alanine racemase [Smithella sp.]HNY50392.1 alanine racemase [Smithella sp.]HOG88989.1 alanine racemase [Smithella sp.]HOU50929.1 alanine racemase [Smithella sp.]
MTLKKEQKYRSWVEVDLDHFISNLREVKRLIGPGVDFMPAVKADAYGHGAIEISHAALKNGATMLGVANADEGVQLRISGIEAPIVILGPSTDSEIEQIIKYNLTPSVSDLSFAKKLNRALIHSGRTLPVHIEVDTGMGRGGTIHTQAINLIEAISRLKNITLEGIFSHFASSEKITASNDQQWQRFSDVLAAAECRGINIPVRHIDNSGAILNYPGFKLNMVRPGLMIYGIYPASENETQARLAPVMSFKTSIVLIKDFPAGYGIGYNSTFVTSRPTRVATIPVGYGDGYAFILSNQGEALICGRRAPIVGRISMDMCTLDVTDIPCKVGDEVVLLGRQSKEYISANEIAAKARTISYEVLCALGKRAPRVFLQKGEKQSIEPRLRRIFVPDEEKSISRIDNIIRHCMQTRARDEELGNAIYYEMFETLFGSEDRRLELRSGFRYNIRIEKLPETKKTASSPEYLHVSTHIEYKKILRDNIFMIGCAANHEQLTALFEDPRCEYRWLMSNRKGLILDRDFSVGRVRIDNKDVPIMEAKNTRRGYEIWCGSDELKKKINTEVKLEIEISTKKARENKIFPVYLVYPVRGLEINFQYEKAGIKNVREESFFAGRHPQPVVSTRKGKSIGVRISDKDWIFPTSGVIFIWDI